jgi:catechol 2,3-dioxygenase-like lactoylglutathione lyase family enzyme
MAEWAKRIGALNLMVDDLAAMKRFYRDTFDLAPLDDEPDTLIYRLGDLYLALRLDPAHQPSPTDQAALAGIGVGQFALAVENVDEMAAELQKRGVTLLSGPADLAWGIRTATFADPAGYVWEISQDTD